MIQDRLATSLNWRPMVGSAVATMVWSSAARNIVSIRLIRMVRTSLCDSGARGASGGASPMSITSFGPRAARDRTLAKGCAPEAARLWGSNLFMPTAEWCHAAHTRRNVAESAYI